MTRRKIAWYRTMRRYRESERQNLSLLDLSILDTQIRERLETLATEIKQFLSIFLLLLFRQTVLGLSDLELAASGEPDETHTEVRTTW